MRGSTVAELVPCDMSTSPEPSETFLRAAIEDDSRKGHFLSFSCVSSEAPVSCSLSVSLRRHILVTVVALVVGGVAFLTTVVLGIAIVVTFTTVSYALLFESSCHCLHL